MASQGVTITVLEQLKVRSPTLGMLTGDNGTSGHCMSLKSICKTLGLCMQAQYGDLYTESNVAMSGIHTHSGPGGYLQYILYIITSLGFVRESFDVLVGGILEASALALTNCGHFDRQMNKRELHGPAQTQVHISDNPLGCCMQSIKRAHDSIAPGHLQVLAPALLS